MRATFYKRGLVFLLSSILCMTVTWQMDIGIITGKFIFNDEFLVLLYDASLTISSLSREYVNPYIPTQTRGRLTGYQQSIDRQPMLCVA